MLKLFVQRMKVNRQAGLTQPIAGLEVGSREPLQCDDLADHEPGSVHVYSISFLHLYHVTRMRARYLPLQPSCHKGAFVHLGWKAVHLPHSLLVLSQCNTRM